MNSDESRAGRGDRREPIFKEDEDRQRFERTFAIHEIP